MGKKVQILKVMLMFFGCLLFLFSVVFPFLYAEYPSIIPEDADHASLWSFRSTNEQIRGLHYTKTVEQWFGDYWVAQYSESNWVDSLKILPLLFVAQVLTLIAGMASILFEKRSLIAVSVILCLVVIALMTYISMSPSGVLFWHYQEGFWLTFPSISLFLSVLLLDVTQKKSVRNTTHTQ